MQIELDMIKVLDHGYVKRIDHMGDDKRAVDAARRSVLLSDKKHRPDADLIDYLMRMGHHSPFESCVVTFEIYAPIFVLRQMMRTRSFSYSELSLRYSSPKELDFYLPSDERLDSFTKWVDDARDQMDESYDVSMKAYLDLQEHGNLPSELARSVLPVAMYSNIYLTGNLRNILRFLTDRLAPGAQYEIRVYAEAIHSIVRDLFPVTVDAWERHILNGIQLSQHEVQAMMEAVMSIWSSGDDLFDDKRKSRIFWEKVEAYKRGV